VTIQVPMCRIVGHADAPRRDEYDCTARGSRRCRR
jgi:hypothetical protein